MAEYVGKPFAEKGVDERAHTEDGQRPSRGPAARLQRQKDQHPPEEEFIHGGFEADLIGPGDKVGNNVIAEVEEEGHKQNPVPAQPVFSLLMEHGKKQEDEAEPEDHMDDPLVHGDERKVAGHELEDGKAYGDDGDCLSCRALEFPARTFFFLLRNNSFGSSFKVLLDFGGIFHSKITP